MRIFGILTLIVLMSACKSTKENTELNTNEAMPEQFMGKVLVTLMPDNTIAELESDFSKFALKHKAIASKSQNQHLFSFDKNAISTQDLIKKLNRSKKVYLAEPIKQGSTGNIEFKSAPKKKVEIK